MPLILDIFIVLKLVVKIMSAVERQIINDVIWTPNTWMLAWIDDVVAVVLAAMDVVPSPDSVANIALWIDIIIIGIKLDNSGFMLNASFKIKLIIFGTLL